MRRGCDVAGVVIATALLGAGCGESAATSRPNPLLVAHDRPEFVANPEVLARVSSTPHSYFRFVNIPFSREVCRQFAQAGTPSFNLHGDAHLEQYAVTDNGRGLTDFDDSSTGPAILDLLRFNTSIVLAARSLGWEEHVPALQDAFLAGYRAALEDPATVAPMPTLVEELRGDFVTDRLDYLEAVDELMQVLTPEEYESLSQAIRPYVETMLLEQPDLEPEFFRIEKIGAFHEGIGSALDRKFLVRVRGRTEDLEDDVVLELKEVRDLSEIECVQVARGADPFRIMVGQARIAYQPYELLGYLRHEGHPFWVHSWSDNYEEVDVQESFRDPAAMTDLVYDVGVQLGGGHTRQIAAPLDQQLRREQMRLLRSDAERIKKGSRQLADMVEEAWAAFREAAYGERVNEAS